jgi:hypothetical protein
VKLIFSKCCSGNPARKPAVYWPIPTPSSDSIEPKNINVSPTSDPRTLLEINDVLMRVGRILSVAARSVEIHPEMILLSATTPE